MDFPKNDKRVDLVSDREEYVPRRLISIAVKWQTWPRAEPTQCSWPTCWAGSSPLRPVVAGTAAAAASTWASCCHSWRRCWLPGSTCRTGSGSWQRPVRTLSTTSSITWRRRPRQCPDPELTSAPSTSCIRPSPKPPRPGATTNSTMSCTRWLIKCFKLQIPFFGIWQKLVK